MVIDSTKVLTKFVFVGGKIRQEVNNSAQREARELGCLMLICQYLACFCDYWAEPGLLTPSGPFGPVQNYIH